MMFGVFLNAHARAADAADLSVAVKTFPLLTTPIGNPANAAIVYSAGNPESKADAESIKAILDGGLQVPGGIRLVTQLVASNELSKLSSVKLAFIAHHTVAGDYSLISGAANSNNVLTICTNIEYVKSNKCVLGVTSKPSVDVYYSPAAAEAAKIHFSSAFTMLTKQVGSM